MTSTLVLLKEDIKFLEKILVRKSPSKSRGHKKEGVCASTSASNNFSCFRIITAGIDEVICEFIDNYGKKYRINGNICESYPDSPPIWFFECDHSTVLESVVEKLTNTINKQDNRIVNQVRILITELCAIKNVNPPDMTTIDNYIKNSNTNQINNSQNNDSGHVSTNNSDNEMDIEWEIDADDGDNDADDDDDDDNDDEDTNDDDDDIINGQLIKSETNLTQISKETEQEL
jgi:hypothetical protein